MSEQLLGTTDAALRLGCSAEWIRRLADAGSLPAMRTEGGYRIFRAEDVDRLAAEREQQRRDSPKLGLSRKLKNES